jgi:hypothetical protein
VEDGIVSAPFSSLLFSSLLRLLALLLNVFITAATANLEAARFASL